MKPFANGYSWPKAHGSFRRHRRTVLRIRQCNGLPGCSDLRGAPEMMIVRRWLAYRRILGELSDLPRSELGTSPKAARDFAWHCASVEAEHRTSRVVKLSALRSLRAPAKKA